MRTKVSLLLLLLLRKVPMITLALSHGKCMFIGSRNFHPLLPRGCMALYLHQQCVANLIASHLGQWLDFLKSCANPTVVYLAFPQWLVMWSIFALASTCISSFMNQLFKSSALLHVLLHRMGFVCSGFCMSFIRCCFAELFFHSYYCFFIFILVSLGHKMFSLW